MARHKYFHKLDPAEELDVDDRSEDDYYGRSVDDEVPISPSCAQFVYNRSSNASSSSRPTQLIPEEEFEDDKGDERIFHIDDEDGDNIGTRPLPVSHRHPHPRPTPTALPNVQQLRLSEKKQRNGGIRSDSRSPARNNANLTPNASSHRLSTLAALTAPTSTPVRTRTRPAETKPSINLMVAGHVDTGKSTLMGHLLLLLGNVDSRTMQKYRHEANSTGKGSFAFAWVLDEAGEERSRGVTMDIARTSFETAHRHVNLLDAPGHKAFIPNMITGASQADAGLLVVCATRGEFETGFDLGGQTREHALILRSLGKKPHIVNNRVTGVGHLTVVVNKMDTVDWLQDRFRHIETSLRVFLEKQTGFGSVQFVPTSGLTGENLVSPPDNMNAQWYQGSTLIQAIDAIPLPEREDQRPLRVVINDVLRSASTMITVSGKVEAGHVEMNDRVVLVPNLQSAIVKGVQTDDGGDTGVEGVCFAGDQCLLTLHGQFEPDSVLTGHVIQRSGPDALVPSQRFLVRLLVFNVLIPIVRGSRAELFAHVSINQFLSLHEQG